jgi:choline dehydrogenase-like flavoprotein
MSEYEYVIVGSGVAGVTLAMLLLRHDPSTSILILEAGPRVKRQDRRYWWDLAAKSVYDSGKQDFDYQPYAWTYDQKGEYSVNKVGPPDKLRDSWYFGDQRLMAYGGSTMHWGGWSLRFKPEDFEMFSRTKTASKPGVGIDWPFDYAHLEKYYCDAEEYLSVCGDPNEDWSTPTSEMYRSKPYPLPPYEWSAPETAMARAFEAHSIKPGKMPLARYRKCLTTGTCKYCPIGARYSADQVADELSSNLRHTNLTIRHGAAVTQILCEKKNIVSGVTYTDLATGKADTVHADRVILCGGTLEIPKLLKTSINQHWSNGIGNDHDLVGRYLVSHSQLKVRGRRNENKERWFQEYDFPTLMSRTWDSEGFQRDGKLFLYNNRKQPNLDLAALMTQGKSRSQIIASLEGARTIELEGFFEDKGHFDNRVDIHGTRTTRFGLPMTRIHFERKPEAQMAADKWLKPMKEIVESMGYTVDRANVNDPGGHHSSGTCRMSPDEKNGVTGGDHRVHGLDNLYVCSNAMMPTLSAVNPTLTLTAMTFRLAEMLVAGTK